ncbi:hypothetical protein EVAR_50860_1 [Eumeta japonica]|uniref:Uncharacterized protein n=1 Tax=Eumeta variegata TaxID=151549 RepID=A0A4C1Y785_EUMVA|nr:hypothetical protein EVAR_50860_1 [Eumeta japonica]
MPVTYRRTDRRTNRHDDTTRVAFSTFWLGALKTKLSGAAYVIQDATRESIVIEVAVSEKNSLKHLRRNVVQKVLEQLTPRHGVVARHALGHPTAPALAVWSNSY